LTPEERQVVSTKRETSVSSDDTANPPSLPPPGLRAELIGKLQRLTDSMPLEDLQLLVEIARVTRRRSLPDLS
jgi:hypothetical protein